MRWRYAFEYELNAVMLKRVNNLLIPSPTKLINRCIETDCFPDSMKIACVMPVHKKGCHDDPGNYGPISILPVLSKVYESAIKNQLMVYFETYQLFSDRQFGFRAGIIIIIIISEVMYCMLYIFNFVIRYTNS